MEETLLEGVRVVRDVMKVEQCYQLELPEMGPSVSKDTPVAASYSAPSTRSVVPKVSPGDSLGTQAKVARSTDPQSIQVTAATLLLASDAIAPRKKSDHWQTKGPVTSKEKSPVCVQMSVSTPSKLQMPRMRKPSSRRLSPIVSDHNDDSG